MASKSSITRMSIFRRMSQVFFLVALNPYFFVYRGFCFPVMNCWACPAAAYGCPIGAIGHLLVLGIVPILTIGVLILTGALVGRFFCGWVCPFGFFQDLLAKVPLPKKKLRFPHSLAYAKYVFLVVTVIWIPLEFGIIHTNWGSASDYFFCNICPAGTLEAAIPTRVTNTGQGETAPRVASTGEASLSAATPSAGSDLAHFLLTSPRAYILYAFLLAFVLFRRPFCRGMCPIGAVFALLNRFSFLRLRVNRETCKSCRICEKKCPADNAVFEGPARQDCVRCLECVDNCRKSSVKVGVAGLRSREGYWE